MRLLGVELVIDALGDSMTMRGPAEYMRPFTLEWSTANVLPSSLDSSILQLSPAG